MTAHGIHNNAAFAWWATINLRKRNIVIAAVKSHVRKSLHKYGIETHNSVDNVKIIDIENNNMFWKNALNKEMSNVGIDFIIIEDDEPPPTGYKKSTRHIIFDVKMDFTRKAGGSKMAIEIQISNTQAMQALYLRKAYKY